jgi:hypothetical protein
MFHSSPQKLRKIMRFSTGKYVVEKKLAMGQTLYESKINPNSSCPASQPSQSDEGVVAQLTFRKSCTIRAAVLCFMMPMRIRNMD